jgi:hypothetical protein
MGALSLMDIVFIGAGATLVMDIWIWTWTQARVIRISSLNYALIGRWVVMMKNGQFVQPCLGFGFAASKTQDPSKARLLSLLAHTAYGIGLYVSALVLAYAN